MNESVPMPVEAGPAAIPAVRRPRVRIWPFLIPSLSDCLFVTLMWLLFISGVGWLTLLGDGDTGMHIRTGELILNTHAAPVRDPYSFTAPDTPWYAWEWLSDVTFASVHRLAGLKGVVLLSGTIICLAMIVLFRHMIWRGAGVHIALLLIVLVTGASSVHFLARPHIFTTLLAVVTLWMLDRDWAKPGRRVWLLVPMAALWANLHGGFLVLIVALAVFLASAMLSRDRHRAYRYGALTAACSAATLLNPYGWQLHLHIWSYLRSDWLLKSIDEFLSPVFRSEPMYKFEVLLFLGLAIVLNLIRTGRYRDAMLIVLWAHAALTSIRHVTIYAIAAAPPIAAELEGAWNHWTAQSPRASIKGILRDLCREIQGHAARTSIWVPVFVALMAFGAWGGPWPVDFPKVGFPTALFARNERRLAGPGHEAARILNADFWGGYLIYKLGPSRHLFIDGRSDYYGPKVVKDYVALRSAAGNWEELANRYQFDFALIPQDWPLAGALKRSGDWALRDQDKQGFLFERRHTL